MRGALPCPVTVSAVILELRAHVAKLQEDLGRLQSSLSEGKEGPPPGPDWLDRVGRELARAGSALAGWAASAGSDLAAAAWEAGSARLSLWWRGLSSDPAKEGGGDAGGTGESRRDEGGGGASEIN